MAEEQRLSRSRTASSRPGQEALVSTPGAAVLRLPLTAEDIGRLKLLGERFARQLDVCRSSREASDHGFQWGEEALLYAIQKALNNDGDLAVRVALAAAHATEIASFEDQRAAVDALVAGFVRYQPKSKSRV